MNSTKGQNQNRPWPFGLDAINVPTTETDVPHNYFAGIASLNVSWICAPVITKITTTNPGGAK